MAFKETMNRLLTAAILVLSSYIGVFFAYIIQQSNQVFSYSVELTSYITAYKLAEYYDGAYEYIRECYNFSDQNLGIVILGSLTFIVFVVLLNHTRKSLGGRSGTMLQVIAFISIVVWFIEPLVVTFSSLENPNISYLIGWGQIPDSDVAILSRTIVQLDRFQLFSRGFYFSFRSIVLATSVLLSALSFGSILNGGTRAIRRTLASVSTISPVLMFGLFSIFSPSTSYHIFGGGDIYIEGVGDVYLGLIVRPFLENLENSLMVLLMALWVTFILFEVLSRSKRSKNYKDYFTAALQKLKSIPRFFLRKIR